MSHEIAQVGDIIELTMAHPEERIRGLRARVTYILHGGHSMMIGFPKKDHRPPSVVTDSSHYKVLVRKPDQAAIDAFEAGE